MRAPSIPIGLLLSLIFVGSARIGAVAAKPERHTMTWTFSTRGNTSGDAPAVMVPQFIVNIDGVEFRDLKTLKAYVLKLPAGSVLRMTFACLRIRRLELEGEQLTIEDFRQYCAAHGVKFLYVGAGW